MEMKHDDKVRALRQKYPCTPTQWVIDEEVALQDKPHHVAHYVIAALLAAAFVFGYVALHKQAEHPAFGFGESEK